MPSNDSTQRRLRVSAQRRLGLGLASLICGLSLLACATASFAATTYYVAASGSDTTGVGSQANPWREIRRALTDVEPGDVILVGDGIYQGFTIANLGDAASPITILAEGDAAEILPTKDRGGQFDPDNIAIWDSTNIVVDGFRSFHATRAAVRIISSSKIAIRNGVYGNNGIWAVVTSHSDDVTVEGCDLYGSREQHGIYFANGGDRPTARGNRIHHNSGSGIRAYGDITQGGDGVITGALFEDNLIFGNYGGGGMNLNAFKDAVIRNNLIYDNHASSGIALFLGEGGIGVADIAIEHNTIDVPADGKYDLRILGTQGPITLRNNVLVNRNGNRGLYSWETPADAASTDGDHNVVAGALFISQDDEATRQSWASWQLAGHEPSSLVATSAALFVDAESNDYHLRAGSPAIDAGATLATVTTDLEGKARPLGAAYDIGAYETVASPGCGDGIVQAGLGEQCDDGNLRSGDCCSSTCQAGTAGDACTASDVCLGAGSCDGTGQCAAGAPPSCAATFAKGLLLANEAVPGKEKLQVKLSGGAAMSQADFGDPQAFGGTSYTLCVYDDADAVVARIAIDRAGDTCGNATCWKAAGKPPGGKGYRYKDAAAAADGTQLLSLKGGSAGKSKLLLKGKNDASAGQTSLPTGIAAALSDSSTASIRLVASDASRCSAATLDTVTGSTALYKAQR